MPGNGANGKSASSGTAPRGARPQGDEAHESGSSADLVTPPHTPPDQGIPFPARPPAPIGKRRRRVMRVIEESEEEEDDPREGASSGSSLDAAAAAAEAGAPPVPPKKRRMADTMPSVTPEQRWQRAKDLLQALLDPLHIKSSDVTLLPDQKTLSVLRNACQTWLNENRRNPQLNYTNKNSFATQMARFLLQTLLSAVDGLSPDVTGCAVWVQQEDHAKALQERRVSVVRCYHNEPMATREHVVELDVNSEAGQRALKEQNGKITENRWHRPVVRLSQPDALCCIYDAAVTSGQHAANSCGQFFTDGNKTRTALAQMGSYMRACYPTMAEAAMSIPVVLRCDCNWACGTGDHRTDVVQIGRQTCKVTPYSLNVTSELKDSVTDVRLLASVLHPALLVFQCCNPSYRRRAPAAGAAEARSCDWKLSAPDLMNAMQLAKAMWRDLMPNTPSPLLRLPELKWHASLGYQNAVLPQEVGDVAGDASPFIMG